MSKGKGKANRSDGFPVDHYSYSSFYKFSTNPFLFKVNNINGDVIETTSSASSVLGKAVHKALEVYVGGGGKPVSADEGEAIKEAHAAGLKYLEDYFEGFIEYNTVIDSRAKLMERYAFAFFGYMRESGHKEQVKEVLLAEQMLKHAVEVEGRELPVPLKGAPDMVYRDGKGRVVIKDRKITSKFSDEEAIDAGKLVQAAFYYFLVHAELGEAPYSCEFDEFKFTENRDKTQPQLKRYEIVYAETPLLFELFYRLYEDITSALNGKQVYVPNFAAIYDREVALLAYIHRLDVDSERAAQLQKMKVDNITDFLKAKIQRAGAQKKLLESVARRFISAKTLNYTKMKNEEKIKMKLAEHGLGVEFVDKVVGSAITLYRYEPSVGLKMAKIGSYVKDIEQVVETAGIRVLAPIAGTSYVGFEVPNKGERKFPVVPKGSHGFETAIGMDISGHVRWFDLRSAPHVLVAGASGSGKSKFLHSIIRQELKNKSARLHLFDPKRVEFAEYDGAVEEYRHSPGAILASLKALVEEMEERYEAMQSAKAKNIAEIGGVPWRFVIIDEFADLSARPGIAAEIQLLAQKGRAAGIHLIVATQRASTKIITGDIKVNFPVKAVFRMSKEVDSRIMIDEAGAEKLLGKGDMLFSTEEGVERLQGFNC